jgi:hypothetical protein
MHTKLLSPDLKDKGHFGDLNLDDRIILKSILKK